MNCPECGNQVSDGARFCPTCGTRLQAPLTQGFAPAPQQAQPRYSQQAPANQAPVAPPPGKAPNPQAQVPSNRFRYVLAALGSFVLTLAIVALVVFQPWRKLNKGDSTPSNSDAPAAAQAAENGSGSLRPTLAKGLASAEGVQVSPQVAAWDTGTNLANVEIAEEQQYLITDPIRTNLERNGFAVRAGAYGYDEFFSMYENNRYSYIPNFVTTDSLMHTYHLYFQYLLKGLERDELSSRLLDLSNLMLSASQDQQTTLKGTEWEDAATRNVAFFAVGASLLDPQASVPSDVQSVVSSELSKIDAASGRSNSDVTGKKIDYSQFIVRGYYEGDPVLERYFRAMMWYGQAHFLQSAEDLDRSALLMMLALNGDALEQWERIYGVSSFFVGASDDCGYYEYLPAVEEAYGENATIDDIIDNADGWKAYRDLTANMPAPQISSLPSLGDNDDQKGFRFMGQRFTVDSQVFSELVFDRVRADRHGNTRMLPDALDVPAAFGSDEALAILEENGETDYEGYTDNMNQLREDLAAKGPDFWEASLYNQWIYTLNPLLEPKGEGYPFFMQNDAWARKNLQSYLASYTELKHDTILYGKQSAAEGDGLMPDEKDDRGYVEPEPEVFARLSRLCTATCDGLEEMGVLKANSAEDLRRLATIADQLSAIAVKELEGELPTDEEFELIRSIGVDLEHFWHEVYAEEADNDYFRAMEFPAPIIADVASGGGNALELATGKVATLLVVIEVDGKLKLATGPVFTFYQFEQPIANRMTDSQWREELRSIYSNGRTERTTSPAWTNTFQTVVD